MSGLINTGLIQTLLSRLSATKSGYLDAAISGRAEGGSVYSTARATKIDKLDRSISSILSCRFMIYTPTSPAATWTKPDDGNTYTAIGILIGGGGGGGRPGSAGGAGGDTTITVGGSPISTARGGSGGGTGNTVGYLPGGVLTPTPGFLGMGMGGTGGAVSQDVSGYSGEVIWFTGSISAAGTTYTFNVGAGGSAGTGSVRGGHGGIILLLS